jgi:hypothetical protein
MNITDGRLALPLNEDNIDTFDSITHPASEWGQRKVLVSTGVFFPSLP